MIQVEYLGIDAGIYSTTEFSPRDSVPPYVVEEGREQVEAFIHYSYTSLYIEIDNITVQIHNQQ